jgi:tetratricopeptide (TPR) repeat protein
MVALGTVLLLAAAVGLRAGSSPGARLAAEPVAASGTMLPTTVAGLQQHLRTVPGDWRAWSALGSAYLDEARISGNPTLYPKAEGAFDRSLALHPDGNDLAQAGRGGLANARHRFADGLRWARRAEAIDARNPTTLGVLGDSLLELGRYPEAFDAFQRMLNIAPGVASYARASYARELQGDLAGATRLFRLARQSAQNPDDAAFADYYLGELNWLRGDLDGAAAAFGSAVSLNRSFAAPAAGLARLAWARGDLPRAIQEYEAVVGRAPLPPYVADLGDLYRLAGRPEQAAEQYSLLRAQQRLLEANGVDIDLELSLFSADHGVDLHDGLGAARAEWERRQSIAVADALAWQLHANHRDTEALDYANQALRLGTRNAVFLFHRAVIEQGLGQPGAAERDLEAALALNPRFSIPHADAAARMLTELRRSTGSAR